MSPINSYFRSKTDPSYLIIGRPRDDKNDGQRNKKEDNLHWDYERKQSIFLSQKAYVHLHVE
jgi:hypothetical protein